LRRRQHKRQALAEARIVSKRGRRKICGDPERPRKYAHANTLMLELLAIDGKAVLVDSPTGDSRGNSLDRL
jgi:hypothetical protein